jgi:hypothetical protein
MASKLHERIDAKVAIAASVASTAIVATKIDTTGFSRARFVFTLGGQAGIGALSASQLKIWKATTSGGTYTSIASAELGAITSGVLSAGAVAAVVDVPTDPTSPWLQVSGSLAASNLYHAAVVELYGGINRPPTASTNQIVTV